MNLTLRIESKMFRVMVISLLLWLHAMPLTAQGQDAEELVPGGQFKDLILPMPINKKLTYKNIWGTDAVIPRDLDNGIESEDWSYWGGNPMLGKDGKYHLAVARWPEETGHWGWPKSEVAHAVAEQPLGPYTVTGTMLPEAHNPEVVQLNDGSYVLHVSKGFIYTSKSLTGPWELLGKIEIDQRGHQGLTHLYTNLTGLQRKDGSFLFFTKRGDVMISTTGLLGPYKVVSSRNYDRYSGYPEDPVIWKSRHQYHVVFNHAVDKKSVYMRSLDGINWKIEPGGPYDKTVFKYEDGTTNGWKKFERPKVLQDAYGRATHLSLAVIDVEKKEDLGNDNHSSKHVILPLVTERVIEIINTEPITSATQEVKVLIKAEKDFKPAEEIDVESLRLGTSDIVNYGGGMKPIASEVVKGDLALTFQWYGMELTGAHYDLKLLGKNKAGVIVYGYALLPGFSDDPAALVTLPIQIEHNVLITEVENFGLRTSTPCSLKVFRHTNEGSEVMKEYHIPALAPYERLEIKLPVDNKAGEYEVVVMDNDEEPRFWRKVDDSHHSIVYTGDWAENTEGNNIYMGSERVAMDKGASVAFFFSGTQARCFGHISRTMGSYDVFVDNQFVERIDCYFGADLHNVVIYQTEVLSDGLHKLELRATGEHYKGNETGPVAVDGFAYID